ncbi:MAG TPA: UDP-N-acetylmuramoyl-tripeptide--D-alanyl-D-alanine ligase [Gaiellaceae bacterium]|nr:UDP-N-acetylmuramoyl-tripeptide--D-alanyl-D-alanine ligase [Gaiellaceae bacterium]
MIPLPLDELRGLGLGRLEGDAAEITGVQIDSRRVVAGDLFVALDGGAAFLEDARARGAAATLVPEDGHTAMAALGRAVRDRSDARVVAITGSVGKTSTKDILAALLRRHRRVVAAEEGFNNEIGLPLTLCRIEPDTEIVVTEMAMRGLGQIRALARTARPELGVITSIAPVHLALLGSIENVARAKAELLEELPAGATAILPAEASELDPFVPQGLDLRRVAAPPVEIRDGRAHVGFRGREVVFSFAARHQAGNAAVALETCAALGVPLPEEPVEVTFSRWRSQERDLPGGGLLINDAWNSNPVALHAALAYLRERAGGRRTVAILGDMAELGAEAARFHEEAGREAAGLGLVLGVGELARHFHPDEWVATSAEAVEIARELVRPGDAVLVKGSRAVGLEVVAAALAEVTVP